MVLKRYGEDKYFTTLAPERTYKTKRGAKQAERMFLHPERWQGWTREGREQADQASQEVEEENEDLYDIEITRTRLRAEEEEEEEEEEEIEEDRFINWYELPRRIQDLIHESDSNKRCIQRLLSNGWTGVYLSDIIEDFGQEVADQYL